MRKITRLDIENAVDQAQTLAQPYEAAFVLDARRSKRILFGIMQPVINAVIDELNYQRERGLQLEQELREQGLTISERPHEDDMPDRITK